MSLEDKRDTILSIFHETKDVFVLKVICHTSYIETLYSLCLSFLKESLMERRILRSLRRSEAWCFRASKTCFRCVPLVVTIYLSYLCAFHSLHF